MSVPVKITYSGLNAQRKVYVAPLPAITAFTVTVYKVKHIKSAHVFFCLKSASVPFIGLDVNFACVAHEHRTNAGIFCESAVIR